jgi:hypothetical protein
MDVDGLMPGMFADAPCFVRWSSMSLVEFATLMDSIWIWHSRRDVKIVPEENYALV